ncbi:MAG: adenylate/guanylate cyclase domain-containing protein [Chloroflexi bacterium]|nr:adenylate/guanylate cyclase domain-containing protein [Chloroflexota bacterium]
MSLAYWYNLLSGWQTQSSDFFFKALHSQSKSPSDRIIIVAIDDNSLKELGRWGTWPRRFHAQVIDFLRQARPRAIMFDILFSEPTPEDKELVQAIRGENVILPVVGIPNVAIPTPRGEKVRFQEFLKPIPEMVETAAALGHANVLPDEDGAVRRTPLFIENAQGEEAPSLPLVAAARYLRRPTMVDGSVINGRLPFAGRSIPMDPWYRMVINYRGGPSETGKSSSFTVIPYVDVIKKRVDPALFEDKLVLVGVMATAEPDSYMTPVSPGGMKMFGVEIHANAIETILNGAFITYQGVPPTITIIFLLALFTVGLAQLRPIIAVTSLMGLFALFILVAFNFFDRGVIVNLVYPSLAMVSTFGATSVYRIIFEEARTREVSRIFGKYVSPQVKEEILSAAEAGELRLGGLRRPITVLFADVRGFTALSEDKTPEDVVRILNTYLSTIVKPVFQHGGMVNKFIGDNVMAVWNAPLECLDHALEAIKAAINGQNAITEMQERVPNLLRISFGIGINTGEAVAGNLGSEDRYEYTVIGDVVNVAARVTEATPGGEVWITADTYKAVKESVVVEEIGDQVLKGRKEAVSLYRVKSLKEKGDTHGL